VAAAAVVVDAVEICRLYRAAEVSQALSMIDVQIILMWKQWKGTRWASRTRHMFMGQTLLSRLRAPKVGPLGSDDLGLSIVLDG
jgi:hypothetical protein